MTVHAKCCRNRLQWLSALQLAVSQSGGSLGYQRQLAARRRIQREAECEEKRRRSSLIHDMGAQLQAEKMVGSNFSALCRVGASLEKTIYRVFGHYQIKLQEMVGLVKTSTV